jgi:SAM-dependent methyltransferase
LTNDAISSMLCSVSLAAEYKEQFSYRSWANIFAALPNPSGQTVLDLGCGIGDQSAELVARGARVIGFDANEELLDAAKKKGLSNAEFRFANLNENLAINENVDGIWCSFVAAYFTKLDDALLRWKKHLKPGGWIAITEIDDLFGHEPLLARSRELLETYVDDSLHAGRYDFRMGRKVRSFFEKTGFEIGQELLVADREFAFSGAASENILLAWRRRFDRMKLLQQHCGDGFEAMRDDFMQCLARPEHQSLAKVHCVLAFVPNS